MSGRKTPLRTGSYYHIYNRGVNHKKIFHTEDDYSFFQYCISFYRHPEPSLSFSRFRRLVVKKQEDFLLKMNHRSNQVGIICYCLMPNHFHFLLRQDLDEGITKFMGNVSNSYARYYNLKKKRSGPLFEGRFKSAFIETDTQLLRLSAYIHLNPLSASIVKDIGQLQEYPWSSYPDYKKNDVRAEMIDRKVILELSEKYEKFVENYQPRESTPGVDNLETLIFE